MGDFMLKPPCPVSTTMKVEANPGSEELDVSSRQGFRIGMLLVINPSGATEERFVIAGFTFNAVLIKGVLLHTHFVGELVVEATLSFDDTDETIVHIEDIVFSMDEACPSTTDREGTSPNLKQVVVWTQR